MPKMTAAERDGFLDKPGMMMRLATVSPENRPLVVPIWFLRDGDSIFFTPRRMSVWLAHIRENNIPIGVICTISGYATDEDARQCIRLGAADHLEKPLNLKQLDWNIRLRLDAGI